MTTPENSSAIDFVPGLAEAKSPAMLKVEQTCRDLLAANTELQRQVADLKRRVASLHNVALVEVLAERDAAQASLAEAHELLNGVREAWNVTGWNAPYHRHQQRRLGREWPRLAQMVGRIVRAG